MKKHNKQNYPTKKKSPVMRIFVIILAAAMLLGVILMPLVQNL